jgi:hypothetical protein
MLQSTIVEDDDDGRLASLDPDDTNYSFRSLLNLDNDRTQPQPRRQQPSAQPINEYASSSSSNKRKSAMDSSPLATTGSLNNFSSFYLPSEEMNATDLEEFNLKRNTTVTQNNRAADLSPSNHNTTTNNNNNNVIELDTVKHKISSFWNNVKYGMLAERDEGGVSLWR